MAFPRFVVNFCITLRSVHNQMMSQCGQEHSPSVMKSLHQQCLKTNLFITVSKMN